MRFLLLLIIGVFFTQAKSQTIPTFGDEIDVTINGLTFDAMESFISYDGNTLFFNNLNDGIDTKLFYATKVDDSTFNLVGEINGTNQVVQPYLDAVADMDSLNNFYWTSTRDYPSKLNNLFHGVYSNGNVTDSGRVYGDFNMNIPGWLVMDHGISADGNYLYYNNARFDNTSCTGVCETNMGVAQKVNDSTFNKLANSSSIMQTINDSNYIFYAPYISTDNLELYYTRYPSDTITPSTLFEMCVAVRNTPLDTFSNPVILFSELISNLIEAPTLTRDKSIMYYHKKTASSHKIVMRYRTNLTDVNSDEIEEGRVRIYPNPMNDNFSIEFDFKERAEVKLQLFNSSGKIIKESIVNALSETVLFNDLNLDQGVYYLRLKSDNYNAVKRIIVLD